ncbi:DHH family phosphoesterase [Candidatus Falkowbacteria bacterium]|nr:DHH family phosphoesterase [Candidatus Falkowbacteria bacterium]
MPLTTEQQIYNYINGARKILVCFKKDFEIDSLVSALALVGVLKKLDKKVTVACSDFSLPDNLAFLPMAKEIQNDLPALKKFIISLDVSRTKVKELSYDIKDGKLKIFITPSGGFFTPEDTNFDSSNFAFDLAFVVDTEELESLGKIYDNNTEFFYEVPIINIDHHPGNEHFGQINHVDLVATSTAEIIYKEIESFGKDRINENLATLLLTGIISKTKNFKSLQITPQTLIATSSLIMAGGRREEIVNNLFRTKSVSDLKLWGRVLARLEQDREKQGLVWSTLTMSDFDKVGVSSGKESLSKVMDELISTIPEAEVVILFYEEKEKKVGVKIKSYNPNINLIELASDYKPLGAKREIEFFIREREIIDVEREIIAKVKEGLKRMGM